MRGWPEGFDIGAIILQPSGFACVIPPNQISLGLHIWGAPLHCHSLASCVLGPVQVILWERVSGKVLTSLACCVLVGLYE